MKVGIIGLGFMGGSLAKSLKKSNKVKEILAYDTNFNSLKNAYNDKVIDDYCLDIDKKFEECDFIFICTPVSYITEYAKKLEKIVKPDCIITDMGSTKRNIIENVKMLDIEFIGAHPMVGQNEVAMIHQRNFYLKIHII